VRLQKALRLFHCGLHLGMQERMFLRRSFLERTCENFFPICLEGPLLIWPQLFCRWPLRHKIAPGFDVRYTVQKVVSRDWWE